MKGNGISEYKLIVQGIAEDVINGRDKNKALNFCGLILIAYIAAIYEQRIFGLTLGLAAMLTFIVSYICLTDTYCLFKMKVRPNLVYLIQLSVLVALTAFISMYIKLATIIVMFVNTFFIFSLKLWASKS